jgi:hypothetical protein
MGQNLSTNRLMPDINVIMTKYFPKYQIIEILNNGMLSKTLLILNGKDPNPLILKCFLKHDYKDEDRKIHKREVEKLNQVKNLKKFIFLPVQPYSLKTVRKLKKIIN